VLIKEPGDETSGRSRELKVKIPLTYHVRLHSMKIMTGRPISSVVREALDRYFRDEARGHDARGGAGDADEKSG
jgi:hypothetical protein